MMASLDLAWEEYGPALKNFIRRRVSDEALVEDILQDVFVKAQSRLDSLRDKAKLKPWIYQNCRHTIIDHYRRKKIVTEQPDTLFVETQIEEERFRDDLNSCVRKLTENLPAKFGQALFLTAYDGLTQKEMSEHLGISVSGAKSRVQRARERLKSELLDCCNLEFDTFGKIIDYTPKER